jgi:hypothetical protein
VTMLTRDRLQALLQVKSGPCVSIYLPTHRQHPDSEQDPIRFKNALREAERLLSDGRSEAEVRALMDPVAARPNAEFWRHQSDGLAILRSPDALEVFRIPLRVPELVVVADSFHVRPLIRSLNLSERYFLLALSQNGVQLFEGSTTSLVRLDVPGMPGDVTEFATSRKRAGGISAHATSRGRGSQRVHAAGRVEMLAEEDLAPYFRAIDRALVRALRLEHAPLILAGVEYYLPIYRKVSRLKHLADTMVSGSPDAQTLDELQTRAWPIASGILEANAVRALEKYYRASERGRSREQLEDIIREAKRGRVRRFFVARGVHAWGTIDSNTGRVVRTETQQGSHDDDLFDDVAEAVLSHGGEVVTLPRTKMPRAAEAVAELR